MATESQTNGVERSDVVSVEELEIFVRYLRAWLPQSLSSRARLNNAGIYDLSCRSVSLSPDGPSTPPRAIDILRASSARIARRSDVAVDLILNFEDARSAKTHADRFGSSVVDACGRRLARVHYYGAPCNQLLRELLPDMRRARTANLLFLHDTGLESNDEQLFRELNALKRTDLLISVSSVWLRQFAGSAKAELWGIEESDVDALNLSHIHRFLANYFRSLIGRDYLVAPFSLLRGDDVYSILFASHSSADVEKFLKAAWFRDPYCCETNFDLYQNSDSRHRLALVNAGKVLQFQKELLTCLESGKFRSDREIYLYTLQRGFLGRHAMDAVAAFCHRYNACFMTRAGKPARARLSQKCISRPRRMTFH